MAGTFRSTGDLVRLVCIVIAACMGSLILGYQIGAIGGILESLDFKIFFGNQPTAADYTTGLREFYDKHKKLNADTPAGEEHKMVQESVPIGKVFDTSAIINSFFIIGSIPGSLLTSAFGERFGRKLPLIAGSLIFIAGVLFQTLTPAFQKGDTDEIDATSRIAFISFGRFVTGFAMGIIACIVPVFVSEVSPPKIRGAMTVGFQLMVTFGIFLATCANAGLFNSIVFKPLFEYFEKNNTAQGIADLYTKAYEMFPATSKISDTNYWRIACAIQMVPCVVFLLCLLWLPESPRSLLMRSRNDDARKNLERLRNRPMSDPDVSAEFQEMKDSIDAERKEGEASWSEFFANKSMVWRLFIAATLQFFQQFSGINAVMFYAPKIYSIMFPNPSAYMITLPIVQNLLNFLFTIPSLWLIEKLGRRTLLVFGSVLMGVAFIALAALGRGIDVTNYNNRVALAKDFVNSQVTAKAEGNTTVNYGFAGAIFVYIFAFALSWGPVVWTYQSEIFPQRFKTKGAGLATMSNWIFSLVMAIFFPVLLTSISSYVFVIFIALCVAMGLFTFFLVPETKGVPLEKMDSLFSRKGRRSAESTATA